MMVCVKSVLIVLANSFPGDMTNHLSFGGSAIGPRDHVVWSRARGFVRGLELICSFIFTASQRNTNREYY